MTQRHSQVFFERINRHCAYLMQRHTRRYCFFFLQPQP